MSTLAALILSCALQASPAASTNPAEVVSAMYAEFPWGDTSIVSAPRPVLGKYFDAELMDLLDADAACSVRTEGICNLNGDPIYNAQDAEISELKVSAGQPPSVVKVSFKNFGQPIELIYRMVDTPAGPRVHDIEYGENQSLRGWLTTPVP